MRYAIWNQLVATEVEHIHRPRDAEEISALVQLAQRAGKRLKAVGAGHSFNHISLSRHVLVDLRPMDRLLAVDLETRRVRVQAGMPLCTLVLALERVGLALPNIGAWTAQTVAGVLSTATHGTGGRYRKSLVEAAVEVRLVDGLGEQRILRGAQLGVLSLGFLGIITEVVLQCERLFFVRQSNVLMDVSEAIMSFAEQRAQHDFVDLRWVPSLERIIVRRWDIVETPASLRDHLARRYQGAKMYVLNRFLGLLRADEMSTRAHRRLFDTLAHAYVEYGVGVPATAVWHEGLTFNSLGAAAPHEEREFAIPEEHEVEALSALRAQMLADPSAASLEVQVRFSPAIDMLLAPNHRRETIWFNLNV